MDFRSKVLFFSMLIPPPAMDMSHNVRKVFMTEINDNLLTSYMSPCMIQDPTYMNFEEDTMQLPT